MYARFVPPVAGQSAAASSGLQYARYVPGQTDAPAAMPVDDTRSKKSKRKRSTQDDTRDSTDRHSKKSKTAKPVTEPPPNDETKPVRTKKDKKDKKDKKKKTKSEQDDEKDQATSKASVDSDGDVDTMRVHVADPEKKKTKREKKKKVEKLVEEEDKDEDEGQEKLVEQNERHKSVLKRKSKSLRLASEVAARQGTEEPEEQIEQHGLEPLPQPAMPREEEVKLIYETLPSWLSAPIRVAQSTRASFASVGIPAKAAQELQNKGYAEAFAVQTAAIPLLLPNSTSRPGDLLVSAATGSGKTLAYALPIVRDISQSAVTRLRALVVLPTRELVRQAQQVFELCAKAYDESDHKRVRIGIAVGSQSLKKEQETLIHQESRYDPDMYKQILQETCRANGLSALAEASIYSEIDQEDSDPRLGPWDGQVIDFSSTVDILICTPGRLVEHLEQTPGFDLDYVRWMVVDEADKLLSQSFQGWLDTVLARFQVSRYGARDFPDMAHVGVRKVVLSATLTRDLSLLGQLALHRPQLIVLETDDAVEGSGGTEEAVAEHTLPELLREFATRVHDANLKPLYLLELLRGGLMKEAEKPTTIVAMAESGGVKSGNARLDSDSASTVGRGGESDDSDSESSSGSGSDTTTSDSDSDSDSDSSDSDSPLTPAKPAMTTTASELPMALIFTKSNESALRLARLLTLLDPSVAPHINTLTSTTPTSTRRKILRAFSSGGGGGDAKSSSSSTRALRLIVASDLVARGIDIPNLAHVVNYDLPPSLAGYVHRVGRTARAGRPGCAWTLVADPESGWFWGKIAKGGSIRRAYRPGGGKKAVVVERARIDDMSDDRVHAYQEALEKLRREAQGQRR